MYSIIIALIFLSFTSFSAELTLAGQVVAVHDGDSCTLLADSKIYKLRLAHIDSPELKQAHGLESRDALRGLILNKHILVEVSTQDRYGRNIAVLFLSTDRSVNLVMVAKGNAWHYKQYSKAESYSMAEAKARRAKLGLWSLADPIPPWSFRRGKNK